MHGQQTPASIMGESRLSTMVQGQTQFPLVRNLAPFKQRGESGAWVSDFWPHVGGVADELCIINSMVTEHVNHNPAAQFLQTGFQLVGRPSIGSWLSYGLGSDNHNLPSFIVLNNMGPRAGAEYGLRELWLRFSSIPLSGSAVHERRKSRFTTLIFLKA